MNEKRMLTASSQKKSPLHSGADDRTSLLSSKSPLRHLVSSTPPAGMGKTVAYTYASVAKKNSISANRPISPQAALDIHSDEGVPFHMDHQHLVMAMSRKSVLSSSGSRQSQRKVGSHASIRPQKESCGGPYSFSPPLSSSTFPQGVVGGGGSRGDSVPTTSFFNFKNAHQMVTIRPMTSPEEEVFPNPSSATMEAPIPVHQTAFTVMKRVSCNGLNDGKNNASIQSLGDQLFSSCVSSSKRKSLSSGVKFRSRATTNKEEDNENKRTSTAGKEIFKKEDSGQNSSHPVRATSVPLKYPACLTFPSVSAIYAEKFFPKQRFPASRGSIFDEMSGGSSLHHRSSKDIDEIASKTLDSRISMRDIRSRGKTPFSQSTEMQNNYPPISVATTSMMMTPPVTEYSSGNVNTAQHNLLRHGSSTLPLFASSGGGGESNSNNNSSMIPSSTRDLLRSRTEHRTFLQQNQRIMSPYHWSSIGGNILPSAAGNPNIDPGSPSRTILRKMVPLTKTQQLIREKKLVTFPERKKLTASEATQLLIDEAAIHYQEVDIFEEEIDDVFANKKKEEGEDEEGVLNQQEAGNDGKENTGSSSMIFEKTVTMDALDNTVSSAIIPQLPPPPGGKSPSNAQHQNSEENMSFVQRNKASFMTRKQIAQQRQNRKRELELQQEAEEKRQRLEAQRQREERRWQEAHKEERRWVQARCYEFALMDESNCGYVHVDVIASIRAYWFAAKPLLTKLSHLLDQSIDPGAPKRLTQVQTQLALLEHVDVPREVASLMLGCESSASPYSSDAAGSDGERPSSVAKSQPKNFTFSNRQQQQQLSTGAKKKTDILIVAATPMQLQEQLRSIRAQKSGVIDMETYVLLFHPNIDPRVLREELTPWCHFQLWYQESTQSNNAKRMSVGEQTTMDLQEAATPTLMARGPSFTTLGGEGVGNSGSTVALKRAISDLWQHAPEAQVFGGPLLASHPHRWMVNTDHQIIRKAYELYNLVRGSLEKKRVSARTWHAQELRKHWEIEQHKEKGEEKQEGLLGGRKSSLSLFGSPNKKLVLLAYSGASELQLEIDDIENDLRKIRVQCGALLGVFYIRLFKQFRKSMSQEHVKQRMEQCDQDADGVLNFAEFFQFLGGPSGVEYSMTTPEWPIPSAYLEE